MARFMLCRLLIYSYLILPPPPPPPSILRLLPILIHVYLLNDSYFSYSSSPPFYIQRCHPPCLMFCRINELDECLNLDFTFSDFFILFSSTLTFTPKSRYQLYDLMIIIRLTVNLLFLNYTIGFW